MSDHARQQRINDLEDQLYDLAAQYRTAVKPSPSADTIVHQYHAVMKQLWDIGCSICLDPDGELPDQVMPDYYLSYWRKR